MLSPILAPSAMTDSPANGATAVPPSAMPTDTPPELYSPEAVQGILQLALAQQSGDGLTRSQLMEVAVEMGISPTTLEAAELAWQGEQALRSEQTEFDRFRRQRFQHHGIRYGVFSLFLITLNYMASSEVSWAWYGVLFWGVGIALHGWKTFYPTDEQYSQAFEKWRRRQQIKRSLRRAIDWLLGT